MINARSVNHIGIDEQRDFYERILGAEFESIEEVPSQKVRVGFFKLGDVRVELLEPTDAMSSIAVFLDKRGEGLHQVAYAVQHIERRFAELKFDGVRLIDSSPRPGARGARIAFVHPKSSHGVLTKLCEPGHEVSVNGGPEPWT